MQRLKKMILVFFSINMRFVFCWTGSWNSLLPEGRQDIDIEHFAHQNDVDYFLL